MKFNQVQLARIVASAIIIGAAFFAQIVTQTVPVMASPARKSTAKNPRLSIRDVRTVFYRRAIGDAYFTAQLRAALVAEGFKFVSSPNAADAILDTRGDSNGRAFSGQMKFTDRNGRLIWSQNVRRPANSNVMAYLKLSQALRVGRKR